MTLQQGLEKEQAEEKKVVSFLREMLTNLRESSNFVELDQHIQELEQWVFEQDQVNADFGHVLSNFSHDDLIAFHNAYCDWETELERLFTKSLLENPSHSLGDYPLSKRFERLLTREVSMLDGQKIKRALFIGSGPFPVSAIYLQKFLGIPVDCLDNRPMAVKHSTEMIENMGLKGLDVLLGDGCTFDASPYDMVLVALLAKPKSDILKNLYLSTKDHCQVICRTSHGFRQLVYEATDLNHHCYLFHVTDERKVEYSSDTISSVLLQKKPLGVEHLYDEGTAVTRTGPITQHEVVFTWPEVLTPERKRMIVELLNAVLISDTHIGFPGILDLDVGLHYTDQIQADILGGNCFLLNIHSKGKLIGMAILHRDAQPNCRHVVEVSKGMIHPDYRGDGIMEAAFLELAEKCLLEGMDLLKLDVREGTKAEKIWRHLGFEVYGRFEDYAREGNQVFAGCYMKQYARDLKKRLLIALQYKGMV